jgi:phospholipid/cholesterol/gamma-HCH transport system substrate-binding protein
MDKGKFSSEVKVGLFVLVAIVLLVFATLKISQISFSNLGSYPIYLELQSANGISKKTPVQIAGIRVGEVTEVSLLDSNRAKVKISIRGDVKLSDDVIAFVKSVGFLGDTYIELYQPNGVVKSLKEGGVVKDVRNHGDFSSLTGQISSIANDVKAITTTMKELMAGQDSSLAKSIKNVEKITDTLANVSVNNEQNLHAIIENLRALSENLNRMAADNGSINRSMDNMASITDRINRGEGTIGRLVNDEDTVDKLNDSIDNLNDLLGSANKLKINLDYHAEYLGNSEEFKNYVTLTLKPKPDKAFLFSFIDDPSPDTSVTEKTTKITSNGVTTEVTEEVETTDKDKFLFSAQLAKSFHDFRLRAGVIESSGGFGVDYFKGPFGLELSAFDFETKRGERPHLKALGRVNLTHSFYLLGGYDDIINTKEGRDWFLGAGISLEDDDIKSLFGLMNLGR